ncbi:hypothetical protein KFU94_22985 [Chloroflexi bacterium TSY]|nr:hypothetical protein [Chloroflexi bacterium TSY]
MRIFHDTFLAQLTIWLLAATTLLSTTTPAAASGVVHNVYLPVMTSPQNVAVAPVYNESLDFNIDSDPTITRLVSLTEKGGRLDTTQLICGANATLEVHVFGSEGEAERLNEVIVQVVHTDEQGAIKEEYKRTGRDRNQGRSELGVVRFNLQPKDPNVQIEKTEVRIIADVDGRKVSSASMSLSTVPTAIPFEWLERAGYCRDYRTCQAFTQLNMCAGNFSWNVAFKRSY